MTTLVNEVKDAGVYKVQFNASNLSSGVYIYQLQTGEYTATKKIQMIK
ncbi:MAG TPA: T9SS type A sorting domain-containing protein [Ignavibacteriaceae bacterium]|nr:T9SS type A sorting domain-containing protein [Ignavibacteriaceae bacterium]